MTGLERCAADFLCADRGPFDPRLVFRRVISRRVQYALWLLVAVRLLIPVSLPAAGFLRPDSGRAGVPGRSPHLPCHIEPVRENVDGPADLPAQDKTPADNGQIAIGSATKDNTRVFTDEKNVTHTVEYARQIHLTDLLYPVWYVGIGAMLVWLLLSNLRFWRMLRRKRVPYEVAAGLYPVFLVEEGLASPCLSGLVSPAIYLTPAAVETPERLRHVIAMRALTPGTSTIFGRCCGDCALPCTGSTPWFGPQPLPPRQMGSWPATNPPCGSWGTPSAFPTDGRCWR